MYTKGFYSALRLMEERQQLETKTGRNMDTQFQLVVRERRINDLLVLVSPFFRSRSWTHLYVERA
jgi:hypothetical protein